MSIPNNLTKLGNGQDIYAKVGSANASAGVSAVDTQSGALTISAGTGITLSNVGNNITVANSGVLTVGSGNSNISITGTPQNPVVNYNGTSPISSIALNRAIGWASPPVQVSTDLTWETNRLTVPFTGNAIFNVQLTMPTNCINPSPTSAIYVFVRSATSIFARNTQLYNPLTTSAGNQAQAQLYCYTGIIPVVSNTQYYTQFTFTDALVGTNTTATGANAIFSIVGLVP
jgi:hypothetical protein